MCLLGAEPARGAFRQLVEILDQFAGLGAGICCGESSAAEGHRTPLTTAQGIGAAAVYLQDVAGAVAAAADALDAALGSAEQEGQGSAVQPVPGSQVMRLAEAQLGVEIDDQALVAGLRLLARRAAHAPQRDQLEQVGLEILLQSFCEFRLQSRAIRAARTSTEQRQQSDAEQRWESSVHRQLFPLSMITAGLRNRGSAGTDSPGSPAHSPDRQKMRRSTG